MFNFKVVHSEVKYSSTFLFHKMFHVKQKEGDLKFNQTTQLLIFHVLNANKHYNNYIIYYKIT